MLNYILKKLTEGRLCPPASDIPSAKIYVQHVGQGKIERADIIALAKTQVTLHRS